MDVPDVTPASVSANSMAMTRISFGDQVLRKVLDVESAQAMALVRMMAQSTGVGGNVDVSA